MRSSKNKSIAMFLPSFEPLPMGGSETQAKRLSKELIKNGYNVFIITVGDRHIPLEETIEGIKVYRYVPFLRRVKKTKPAAKARVVFDYSAKSGSELIYPDEKKTKLKQIMEMAYMFINAFNCFRKHKNEFDILQINTITSFAVIGAVIATLLRKKLIIKDSTMDGLLQMHQTPFPGFARKFLIKHTNIFVAMTKMIGENLLKAGGPPEKIVMIPNGIEIAPLGSAHKTFSAKCLFVGNLYQQPAKGVDILLKAWKTVLSAMPKATLTIVGDGSIEEYRRYAQEQGLADSIFFTGKRNPLECYLTHDIFVLPSRREGMSNALMEAMMYGLPVAATDISGNQDLIDGEGGILAPPNNAEALAEAIITLLNSPESLQKMGARNREKVIKECFMEKAAKLYMECYERD